MVKPPTDDAFEGWRRAIKTIADSGFKDAVSDRMHDADGSVLTMTDEFGHAVDGTIRVVENGAPEETQQERERWEPHSTDSDEWGQW